ncbi:MAG: hypothetical protein M3Y87_36520, partial [Myxococcota bacterium]|nr:hypothetical protein [Myxococcota bacterium]
MVRRLSVVLGVASWWIASVASADASLDRARALLEQADFAAAIEAYDQAAEGDALGRAELVELLEGRARA